MINSHYETSYLHAPKPGKLFIIAERPSMVFSCEMTSSQIVQRLLFALSRYAITNLRDGIKPQKKDLKRIKRVAAEINLAKKP